MTNYGCKRRATLEKVDMHFSFICFLPFFYVFSSFCFFVQLIEDSFWILPGKSWKKVKKSLLKLHFVLRTQKWLFFDFSCIFSCSFMLHIFILFNFITFYRSPKRQPTALERINGMKASFFSHRPYFLVSSFLFCSLYWNCYKRL